MMIPQYISPVQNLPSVIAPPKILVLGYGNPGRQDDGLGPAVVSAIAELGQHHVTTIDNYHLMIEDAITIASHDVVWFVDALQVGDEPCRLRSVKPAFDFAFTSHLLKPETLLGIVAQQFHRQPEAWLLGIRGYQFDFHEGLTDEAHRNLALAVTLIRRRLAVKSRRPL